MQVKIGNLKILLTTKLEISLMIFILKIIYFGCIEISANFMRALNFGRVCNYSSIYEYCTIEYEYIHFVLSTDILVDILVLYNNLNTVLYGYAFC